MNISHISCSEILIVSLTVTGSIGLITYYSDSNALGQQAYREQKQILTKRGQAFTDAKNTLLSSLIEHLNSPNFKEKSVQILSSKKRFRPDRSNIISRTDGNLETSRLFQTDLEAESMSILTAGAIIALSTETKKIGRYQPVQNTTTYVDPQKSNNVGLRFFKDPRVGRPTTTIALPIRDNSNKRRGYYAVDINPKTLHASMFKENQSSVLSPPENTYAVAYTSLSRITEIYNHTQPNQYPSLKSEGINNALNNRQGGFLYLNHERKPVVGAYQYIPAANMGLLVERDQSILFKQARKRLRKILVIGTLLSTFTFIALRRLKSQGLKKSL